MVTRVLVDSMVCRPLRAQALQGLRRFLAKPAGRVETWGRRGALRPIAVDNAERLRLVNGAHRLALVAELVDAHGSGPCAARRGSSSLLQGTISRGATEPLTH